MLIHSFVRQKLESLLLMFESQDTMGLEAVSVSCREDMPFADIASLLLLCEQGDWSAIHRFADELFAKETDPFKRVFILHFAVAASEVEYDLAKRDKWMARWREVQGWSEDPWCRYFRSSHEALTSYFRADLFEAEARFQQTLFCARQSESPYAEAHALYHLALIDEERGLHDRATARLREAESLAVKVRALRLLRRIQSLLVTVHAAPGSGSAPDLSQVETLLGRGQVRMAKRLLLHMCRARRFEKRQWRSGSEYIYLAVIRLVEGHLASFRGILAFASDLVIREKILALADRLGKLPSAEKSELAWLRDFLGVKLIRTDHEGKAREIGGVAVSLAKDDEVASLIQLVCEKPEGVTKEEICLRAWKIDYDPVVHDPRIYKLIMRARKQVGQKDWLVNTYGRYRLNPRLTQGA